MFQEKVCNGSALAGAQKFRIDEGFQGIFNTIGRICFIRIIRPQDALMKSLERLADINSLILRDHIADQRLDDLGIPNLEHR